MNNIPGWGVPNAQVDLRAFVVYCKENDKPAEALEAFMRGATGGKSALASCRDGFVAGYAGTPLKDFTSTSGDAACFRDGYAAGSGVSFRLVSVQKFSRNIGVWRLVVRHDGGEA